MRTAAARFVAVAALVLAAAAVATRCGGNPAKPSPNPGGGGTTPNAAPTVKSITASDSRAEVGVPVTLTATVEDAETPIDNLTYAWTADNGTFAGTGRVVTWTPGADAVTPGDFTVTLTVTERYTSGSSVLENKATGTVTIHVNNSPKELADLSLRFLTEFADSKILPDQCVAEFSDSCPGKKAEREDIIDNRHDFQILASSLHPTGLQLSPSRTTATVHTACTFTSRVITTSPQSGGCRANPGSCIFGSVQTVDGDCWTTNVYDKGRWWLCESHFSGEGPLTSFERAFFGLRSTDIP
jgi:hypothetical protein